MPRQQLDERQSTYAVTGTPQNIPGPTGAPTRGTIGLQTAGVLPENAGDIRVTLMGSVQLSIALLTALGSVTIRVERGGNGTRGSGTVVYQTSKSYLIGAAIPSDTISFVANDFHPPNPASGELRYDVYVTETGLDLLATLPVSNEAVTFYGSASAGTNTGDIPA